MEELKKMESDLSNDDDSNILPPGDIVAFNELRSCADLFRMYEKKQLNIQPDFQRNFVWEPSSQTRFIDSLIKQLPIPSICISLDYKTEKRIVIDGLQRISTIIKFLSDDTWRLSRLSDVDPKISGKLVSEIKSDNYNLYERVENVILPVTVLRCDYSSQNHMDYLFTIFHRLNTGGLKLNNQEIRNCIYSGNFNNLLRDVSDTEVWVKVFGKPAEIDRLASEELILRTFAFVENLDNYAGNLARFLNHYMSKNRNLSNERLLSFKEMITGTLELINNNIDDKELILNYGKTLKEGFLVGVAKNLNTLKLKSKEEILEKFRTYNNSPEFKEENIREGLSAKDKVQSRLKKSISIFGE